MLPFLHLTLPVMDEEGRLQRLFACLEQQTYRRFRVFVCVNQPDGWHGDPVRQQACRNNAASLAWLRQWNKFPLLVIDHATPGNGWKGKRLGVGFARRTAMEPAAASGEPGDIIVSLDADTVFGPRYLETVARNFAAHPDAAALAVPYYHELPEDPAAARAILRYEIYMRHYFLNLARIGSPYAFTALGSAMAVPVRAYRAIGGMTPKLSGEDFYFLQKLRKYGEVLLWNEEPVYPEARFSDRVFFGTGPAMIRGAAGDWDSYPIYSHDLFNQVEATFRILPDLFRGPVDTPVTRFMASVFREEDPIEPIRRNHPTLARFTRGFHEKFDGLRTLQFLKAGQEKSDRMDEENLWIFLDRYASQPFGPAGDERESFSFGSSPPARLDAIRRLLWAMENEVRVTSVLR